MTTESPPNTTSAPTDREALIREARRRQRRRWTVRAAALLGIGAGVGLGVGLSGRVDQMHPPTTATSGVSRSASRAVAALLLKSPDALAVGPNDDLYLVDAGRDEVLRRLPTGTFQVVAGDGRQGFSGDRGPATHAELRLGQDAGLAVAGNGTVYVADIGNDRVRAVLPSGKIETVAGGGRLALPAKPGASVPARSADLGSVAGLAIGPGGGLYIAARFIVRLTSSDELEWVAGSTKPGTSFCSTPGCPADERDFQNASWLAFGGGGNLVVSGGSFPGVGWALGEIRADGRAIYLTEARGTGGRPASVASGPDGSVIIAAENGLYRLAEGSTSLRPLPGGGAGGNPPSAISRALTASTGLAPHHNTETFFSGVGIATGAHGQIYADAQPFMGLTFNTLVELSASGKATVLWRSSCCNRW